MSQEGGFTAVIRNRNFLFLWMAQAFSQTAQNAINFVQIVLIEKLTGSSSHMALIILAFSLPAVLFSSLAGVAVDHLPNKLVLMTSNALRVLTVSGYIFFLYTLTGGYLLTVLYLLTFVSSTIGQFFSPAEATTIPLLVGERRLLSANALFNLTITVTQVAGFIIFAPLAIRILGIPWSFAVIALMYLTATLLVSLLPHDVPKLSRNQQLSIVVAAWEAVREGWRFVISRRPLYMAIIQLSLVAGLFMTLAMLAPGFVTRVLHLTPEDAVYVFAPAGAGLFLATFLVGRFGHQVRRESLSDAGLFVLGFSLLGLSLVAGKMVFLGSLSPLTLISLLSLLMGAAVSMVIVPAQTVLQERSTAEIRGRVLSIYFMVSNMAAIPPMLFMGVIADQVGILPVMTSLAIAVLLLAAFDIWRTRQLRKEAA